jgi:acyl-CoA synthetase (NDP forming)
MPATRPDLGALLRPRSIAVVGASAKSSSGAGTMLGLN